MKGIILVYKEKGWTSFDVVAKLRGILGERRLGHAGTLDPMATGILPVFAGKATKACDMLPVDEKSYIADFKLGLTTDTQDITGTVISESKNIPERDALEAAAKEFVGDIMQLPPMYSAVKVDGKKLYQLAREGRTVERKPKPRRVESLKIESYDEKSGEGRLFASVSKGTYIRTLINDIGEKLGCGGVMTELERISACGFVAKQCHTIEEIQQYKENGRLEELIMPVSMCFETVYKDIRLGEKGTSLYKNGVKLHSGQVGIKSPKEADGEIFCVFAHDGEFLGIARYNASGDELCAVRNFYNN